MAIIKYEHHGTVVSVDENLKGKHRECCLCFKCTKLDINDRNKNCERANELYAFCVKWDMTTPVFECPVFEQKD
jgi:hypothetical protein